MFLRWNAKPPSQDLRKLLIREMCGLQSGWRNQRLASVWATSAEHSSAVASIVCHHELLLPAFSNDSEKC